jgi:hypothetical protein
MDTEEERMLALVELGVLRAFREVMVPSPPDRISLRWAGAVPLVLDRLVSRGLLQETYRGMGMYQTTAVADRLLDAAEAAAAGVLAEYRPCPFTQSHTRDWCGHLFCRES